MRGAAAVKIHESDESKFLGPSSGIAITRLVMQLAKQFTDSKSISDIVPDARAKDIKATFDEEDKKPTSKVYPLISDVAAEELPNRDLTNLLVELFYSKGAYLTVPPASTCCFQLTHTLVHPMYPIFHEPTFTQDVEDVYNGSTDPYQNYCLRMVIAISLQKMDTQYAGLADSYYLAALKHFEASIKPMNLKTLQCFALVAGYSLLTPTRTAVYYIIGLGVRLCQVLGLHEEKTITMGRGGRPLDTLEVDMRRRMFWSLLTMEYGLAHSLGRPSHFATRQEHIDVGFCSLADDAYISPQGIQNEPQASLKKWIAIHFFKMRMLQLEIRRKLYQRKRREPKNDQDPWFAEMQQKMMAWRDTSPEMDGGSGLNKVWFTGRYNTMVVFLYRPSPQVPRPSLQAAQQCYDACQYNIYMTKRQIETKSVDMTWIFTQAIFMAINTMLWTLSYSEVRQAHSREEVEGHLRVALDSIELCSDRWPGVASAHQLYRNLIGACMKIFEKDGDVPISAGSPSDSASVVSNSIVEGINRSRTTSPATASTASLNTPSDPPFGYITSPNQQSHFSFNGSQSSPATQPASLHTSPQQYQPQPYVDTSPKASIEHHIPSFSFTSTAQFAPLPTTFAELPNWHPNFSLPQHEPAYTSASMPPISAPNAMPSPLYNETYATNQGYPMVDYLYPQWSHENVGRGIGLNQAQQMELMQTFEQNETRKIEAMIHQSNQLFKPHMAYGSV